MGNNSTTLKVIADKELQELLSEKMRSELIDLPEGSLCQKTIRGKKYFYHYTYLNSTKNEKTPKEKQKYLSKKETALKINLQRKGYIEKSLCLLNQNIAAARDFLEKYEPFTPVDIIGKLSEAYSDFSIDNYTKIFGSANHFNTDEWKLRTETTTKIYPENLTQNTASGLKVRSKSESIIAMLLDVNEIPYRYEDPLLINEHIFYPDFTVMRPADQKIFYWEHFGMLGNQHYEEQMQKKLLEYISHGLMPWDQLILTTESNEDAFDAEYINKIIKILLL